MQTSFSLGPRFCPARFSERKMKRMSQTTADEEEHETVLVTDEMSLRPSGLLSLRLSTGEPNL